MSANRQRLTWAALNRGAAAPPALPGYDVEDQDHPAHTQDDPEAPDYMIGGPSEFAEDVHKGPYGDSGKPALPGVGVEDQDHPAHKGQVGRQANLMALVRKKAAKALRFAKVTLGAQATRQALEDQAFAFMSMDEAHLDASLARAAGGFMAEAEPEMMAEFGDSMVADDNPVMARLQAMEQEIASLRAGRQADQNDPNGKTLGAAGKTEEQAKAEEQAVSNKSARAKLARLFTACDMDQDGFVTEDDWMGSPAVFAALDTDRDGIIAKHEVMAGEVPDAFKKNWDKGDDKDDDKKDDDKKDDDKSDKSDDKKDEKESGKKASKKAESDEDEDKKDASKKAKKADEDGDEDDAKDASKKKAGKKAEDDEDDSKDAGKKAKSKKAEDDEDEKDAGKKSGKKASDEDDEKDAGKKAFGHLADFDDDELEMLQSMQYGMDDIDDGLPVMASDDDEDKGKEASEDDETDADKEASFFSGGFDPMGLSDGSGLTAADKAAFESVFGKQADDEDGEDKGKEASEGEDDEDKGKEAMKLASLLRPQGRKASTGVKSVGAVAKTASKRDELSELSSLWASDPDVSGSFS